jgi:F-box-like
MRRVIPEMTTPIPHPLYIPGPEKTISVRNEIRSHELDIELSLKEIQHPVPFLCKEQLPEMALIAPIHYLPSELLSQLFIEYSYSAAGSPWDLIFVCRLWKEVAFDTALLWAKISCRHWSLASNLFRLEGREVCCLPLRLKKTLERTKSAPIDIEIDVHGAMDNDMGRQMLELLSGAMGQWRHLELVHLDYPSTMDPVPYLAGDLTCLEQATLWASIPPLLKSIEDSATSLRKLTVGQAVEFHKHAANPRWTQLTHFALHGNHHTEPENELRVREVYSKMLRTCTQLQVLHIYGAAWAPAASCFPPSLRECTLRWSTVTLSQAHLPRLTSLCLDTCVSIPQETMHFPELHTLEFTGINGLRGLAVFSAPALHTMKIDCAHGKQEIGRLWGKGGHAANLLLPRVLHLRNYLVSANAMISALRVLRNLEELYLTASPASEKQNFYQSFLPSKRNKRHQILGPKLKTLVVDMNFPYIRRGIPSLEQELALWDAMVEMAAQRKAKDIGIDSFRIRATRLFDGKWVNVRPDALPLGNNTPKKCEDEK